MAKEMRLSHVLYKVKDLHQAVKDFEDMGFTVRYGKKKEKATNALIWFEDGRFIELFTINESAKPILRFLKLFGKKAAAKRFLYYANADYGWVDYAIENDRYDLEKEKVKLKALGCKYSNFKGLRTNINGLKLKWLMVVPDDLGLPFLMTDYNPSPRPETINHPNGATSISTFVWGASEENIKIIRQFTSDEKLILEQGEGFKKIELEGFDADVLNQKYYKE